MSEILTEIRTFYSIREIKEVVEERMNMLKILLDEYSQWLGALLRDPERLKDQEWGKKMAEIQKILKTGGKSGSKKEGKTTAAEWVNFRDLLICADEFGEVEVLFEAIEDLKAKIDKLGKIKNALTELERYNLGKNIRYVTYIKDGVPEKVAFKLEKKEEQKFKFIADFTAVGGLEG
ncbi:MAG: hypothetical protein QXT06_07805 [Candidatus Bathyarchaeia archaeon]|nr:hypothetical protein [Candidatus Bathyarchaeota archaeon]